MLVRWLAHNHWGNNAIGLECFFLSCFSHECLHSSEQKLKLWSVHFVAEEENHQKCYCNEEDESVKERWPLNGSYDNNDDGDYDADCDDDNNGDLDDFDVSMRRK